MPRQKLLSPNYRLRLRGRAWYLDWTDPQSGRTRSLSTGSKNNVGAELFLRRRLRGWETEPPPREISDADRNRIAKLLHDRAKDRASRQGMEIAITKNDLIEMLTVNGGRCAVTGAQLDFSKRKREIGRRPWVPSLDRIDATKGYTLDNCRIVCCAANIAMNTWGEVVFASLLRAYERSMADGFLITGA